MAKAFAIFLRCCAYVALAAALMASFISLQAAIFCAIVAVVLILLSFAAGK